MKGFIEVTVKGKEQTIRVDHIIRLVPFNDGCKIITTQITGDQNKTLIVEESYDSVRILIEAAIA